MRDKHICPKCDHREVVRFPQLQADRVPVCAEVRPGMWQTRFFGRFEAYVCAKCSYAELYMLDLEEAKANVQGVQLLEGPPEPPAFR